MSNLKIPALLSVGIHIILFGCLYLAWSADTEVAVEPEYQIIELTFYQEETKDEHPQVSVHELQVSEAKREDRTTTSVPGSPTEETVSGADGAIVHNSTTDGGVSTDEARSQSTRTSLRLIEGTPPSYPLAYRRQGIEGTVVVLVLTDRNGRLEMFTIESSTHEGFEKAVENVIGTYVFDQEVEEPRQITFQFTLEEVGII